MDENRPPLPAQDSQSGSFTDQQIAKVEEDIQRTDEIIRKTRDAIARSKKIIRSK